VIGKGVAGLAASWRRRMSLRWWVVEHDLLEAYTPDGYCVALSQVIAAAKPDLVLFPHTYQVRDFAPKLAAMLGKGMIGDCIGYRNEAANSFCAANVSGQDGGGRDLSGRRTVVCFIPGGRVSRRPGLPRILREKAPVNAVNVDLKPEQIRTKRWICSRKRNPRSI